MQIGYVSAAGRGETDRLLSALAARLEARGLRLIGVVQTNTDRPDCVGCDMDVRVLPGTRDIRISQSLGPQSRGCRLDASALEEAVGLVEASLSDGADLLVVNKFGKHEADGRGFRGVIGEALARDIPVIVGLNAANTSAFVEFTDAMAVALSPTAEALEAWALSAVQTGVEAG